MYFLCISVCFGNNALHFMKLWEVLLCTFFVLSSVLDPVLKSVLSLEFGVLAFPSTGEHNLPFAVLSDYINVLLHIIPTIRLSEQHFLLGFQKANLIVPVKQL